MISLPSKNRRALLWLCFRGIELEIALSLKFTSHIRISATSLDKILLGQLVKGVDPFTAQRIREKAEQEIFPLGDDEFTRAFREYRRFLDYELWQTAARRAGVKVCWVRAVLEGKNNSPAIVRALEDELESRELVSADTPLRRRLDFHAQPIFRRLLASREEARRIPPARPARGYRQAKSSAPIAAALAAEMLTIERRAR